MVFTRLVTPMGRVTGWGGRGRLLLHPYRWYKL